MNKFSVPFEIKKADESGAFEGYASRFGNIDLGAEVIAKDAVVVVKAGQNGRLKLALNHDTKKMVGNAAFEVVEDGLIVKGKINLAVSYAKDAYELMKDGTLDEMSIGFNILESENKNIEGKTVKVINALEIWEASIVPFGMNPEAKILQVKSIRDFEQQLRDIGYSKKDATAVALHGFAGLQRDAVDTMAETAKELENLNTILGQFCSKT
jgi:HK97 family phage prohead protease